MKKTELLKKISALESAALEVSANLGGLKSLVECRILPSDDKMARSREAASNLYLNIGELWLDVLSNMDYTDEEMTNEEGGQQ